MSEDTTEEKKTFIEKRRHPFIVYCERVCTPNILLILLFEDGRKVGLGAWIYFTSTAVWLFSVVYNAMHPPVVGGYPIGLTFEQYMFCLLLATCLVGGGTVIDTFMKMWFNRNGKLSEEDKDAASSTPAA